jgi:chorismate mutase
MNWFEKLLDLATTIPGTFWGVLVGSFFSIGGVMLSNRASDRRLQAQFKYERELRISDSELSLRKDIYLEATEAISAGFLSLGKMADLEIPNNDVFGKYTEKSPAISKIQIIGNENTLNAIADISSELAKAIMKLSINRMILLSKKQELTRLDELISKSEDERDRMLSLMKQYNLDQKIDKRLWDTINDNFELEQKRVSEALEKKTRLAAEFFAGQIDYTEECASESIKLSRLLVPAVIAVRHELNIPINENNYGQIIEESYAKQTEYLKDFLGKIRDVVNAQIESVEEDSEGTHKG